MHTQGNVKKGPPDDPDFLKGCRSKVSLIERSVVGYLRRVIKLRAFCVSGE